MRLLTENGTGYFWQWDTGRKIVIIGDEDICGEAHFCTGSGDLFPVAIRTEDGQRVADVPDEVLQEAKPVSVYLYRKDGSGASTRYHQRFIVHPRTKPTDYVYTPAERQTWEQLSERITALEEEMGSGGMPDDLEQIALLVGTDMLPAVHDSNGAILTDESGNIILRY